MLRVAWRSLLTRPVRAAVLAAGFGFGIAVMAVLLGVGEVIVEQARAPVLAGGGDLVLTGPFGPVTSARYVLSVLDAPDIRSRLAAASATRRERLFLITSGRAIPVSATGGVPSREKAVGDPEAAWPAWQDGPEDAAWVHPDAGAVLRAMDRFHAVPEGRPEDDSWAEWLYFNGRTPDGRTRVYVTFLVGAPPDGAAARGAPAAPATRPAGVRLQLEHDGRATAYSAAGLVDAASVLASAPDLDIAGNRVRLEGSTYVIALNVAAEGPARQGGSSQSGSARARRLTGTLRLAAAEGRSVPPATVRGAGGWVTGYTVPVLAGRMDGVLEADGTTVRFDGAPGYHDHNWGFWKGVSWQWGQVAHEDLSIVYGRVFPPSDVADPRRMPGFLVVLGPEGLLGFSSEVAIDDRREGRIEVRARRGVDLQMTLVVDETVRTAMALTARRGEAPMDFLQLGGTYRVAGRTGGRALEFSARGSAETFKRRPASSPGAAARR